jgi:WD40 repeat protein
VTAVAITADGQTAATGSLTGDVVVWDVETGIPLHRFSCPAVVSALALTPNGERVLVGDHESLSVHPLADTSPQQPIARLITRSGVTALAVNPALPAYVLCGTASGQVAYVRTP